MTTSALERVSIVGVGQTRFSSDSHCTEESLAIEASLNALEDAGLSIDDIDGLICYTYDSTKESDFVTALGLKRIVYFGQMGYGGAGSCAGIGHAAAAIASGQATCVLCYRGLNGRSGVRYGRADYLLSAEDATPTARGTSPLGGVFTGPYGLLAPGQIMAMWGRRYMHQFGISDDQMAEMLASVVLAQRGYAQQNPNAMTYGNTLTFTDYLSSRMLAEPLRLYDFCRETDGGCAVVLTTRDRATMLRQTPVRILAAQQCQFPHSLPSPLYVDDLTQLVPTDAASALFGRAGIEPGDVDVAAVYDATSVQVILTLENFGFCERGGGGEFVRAGEILIDGRLPTNTHGGLLSEGHIHGLNSVIEAVKQMRGTSFNQVPGAQVAFVTARASSLILAT
jgi:acetyl-CoA acetyltransferase